tara:strand:- start:32 stop:610 length:579 start_codon:yes stop_codon:yes gene_type:complete
MIRIGIIGDIGSGKSHVAKLFGYPVFNADNEVNELYKKSRRCYKKLKKALPKYITSFPVNKNALANAIIDKNRNLKKIIKIVHPEVRSKMNIFVKKNKNKRFVVLDIPLLIENKINKKNDILVFVAARQKEIKKRLKNRSYFNVKILNKFKKIQLSSESKQRKSHFIIKNNFNNNYVKRDVKKILKKILLNV